MVPSAQTKHFQLLNTGDALLLKGFKDSLTRVINPFSRQYHQVFFFFLRYTLVPGSQFTLRLIGVVFFSVMLDKTGGQ